MPSRLHAQMFASLVRQVGGVDAACAAIEAEAGEAVSRGTISKIQNGHASVPTEWQWALEDATGNYCFTNYRNNRLRSPDPEPCDADGYTLTGKSSKEHGEAVSKGIEAEHSADAGDHARAAVEWREAEQAARMNAEYHENRAGVATLHPVRGEAS